jgi:hypothetical protein
MKITSIIFLLFIFKPFAYSQVEIAFFKIYKSDGSLIQLEENGQFAHVALSTDQGWLHSHPYKGVILNSDLDNFPFRSYQVEVLSRQAKRVVYYYYNYYLDLPYDNEFSWDDEKLYCSEVIAKILNIKPTPMSFDSEVWGDGHPQKGKLGISPDEIYEAALRRGFKKVRNK